MNTQQIHQKASSIAGALWDDRRKVGTLAEQLRTVAAEPTHGVDGEITGEDRKELLTLAEVADAI